MPLGALRDVDGYADHVASTSDNRLTVARNRTGRTNLLKSVSRPLGASIDLEYKRDGNTVADPNSRWVLAKTTLTDGHPGDGVDTQVSTYQYEDGAFDRLEREFFGYRKVTETHHDASNGTSNGAPYRSVVFEYRNDSFHTKGLPTSVLTLDGAGAAHHDLRFGSIASSTDPNGNRTSYVYDGFGRLTSVTGPYQQGGSTPTLSFE